MKIRKSDINKYYDSRMACCLLSCLLKNPKLALSREFPLWEHFFVTKTHRALYVVIENLAKMGLEVIKLSDIEGYLANHDQLNPCTFLW